MGRVRGAADSRLTRRELMCRDHRRRGRLVAPPEYSPDWQGIADMQRWRGLEDVPGDWGSSVVTFGVFDGVHRGHQQVIGRARQTAS